MYLQITTRCNMTCEHCCFDCKAVGIDMTVETARAAMAVVADRDEYITIGGGEPTLNPHFWEILGLCIGYAENVHIITNGSITDTALALAKLAQRGVIGAELSLDEYHNRSMVDDAVVDAFDVPVERQWYRQGDVVDRRGVRGAPLLDICKAGRAETNQFWNIEDCCCDDLFIDPTGTVWACGCQDMKFGTVQDGFDAPKEYPWDSSCSVAWRKSQIAA